MIATFPSLSIDIERYPAVKQHLLSFGYNRLKQTGESGARKKTNNKWFETQDSINYWEDFSKQKIIYPDIMRLPRKMEMLNEYPYFYFDEEKFFIEATNFMMIGRNIDIIYLFLVSDLGFYAFSKFYAGPQFDSTGFRYKKVYLDGTFVPKPNSEKIIALQNIMKCLNKQEEANPQINQIWSEIVGLNYQETSFISQYKKSLLS